MKDQSAAYELLGKLGTGSFGTVWKARHKASGDVVAIKQIDLESSSDDIAEIQQEIALLSECQSEYVTRYYESFITGFRLWIVMEYLAGGSALDAMQDRPFTEQQAAVMCRELLQGLAYLHSQNKIHRDIKAANVLMTESGQVKLADFGVAAQLSSNMSRRHTFVGTPFWMAPEVIKQAGYNYKADIWSLGITAIELLKGEPPLTEFHPMRAIFLIPKSPAPLLTGRFSSQCKDFVAQCLQLDVQNRPSAEDLLSHPFIKQAGSSSLLANLSSTAQQDPATPVEELALLQMSLIEDKSATGRREQSWDFDTIKAPTFPQADAKRTSTASPEELAFDGTIRPRKGPAGSLQQMSRLEPGQNQKLVDSPSSLTSSWRSLPSNDSTNMLSVTTQKAQSTTRGTQHEFDSLSAELQRLASIDALAVEAYLQSQLETLQRQTRTLSARSPIAELLFMRWADELRRRAPD